MRVYQINVVCGSGSTGRIAADISRMLERNGSLCRIAYGRGQAPKGLDTFKISNSPDTYLHALMTRLTDRHGLYSVRATRRLIENIREYRPDIIHLHNIHGYYVNYELLFRFLKQYGKPVVWTMHDCWAITGHCAHYDSNGCTKWQEDCAHCPHIQAYPASLRNTESTLNYERKKRLFTGLDGLTIVTPSVWLKEQIEKSFLSKADCITIPNGIDLDKFQPRKSDLRKKLGCTDKKLLLGVASVWTKNKGFEDFLKLRKLLGEEYLICMVGLNKKQLKNLPEGIIGISKTESMGEMAEYYSAADLFLNLTYEDTFPTTNIEALACGTPVVTYRTGGSPEIVGSDCGTSVEKGNIQELIKEIEIWADKSCKESCRERAMGYEKDACYERYLKCYEKMCSAWRTSNYML